MNIGQIVVCKNKSLAYRILALTTREFLTEEETIQSKLRDGKRVDTCIGFTCRGLWLACKKAPRKVHILYFNIRKLMYGYGPFLGEQC